MCQKCGCNTCETIRGPLLTEGKVKKLVSENLQYHIDKNIPLMENVFRIGSDAHLSMIKEARKLYTRGVLDLCEEDEALMKTHIGEFDLYENEIVPLDLPMLEEDKTAEKLIKKTLSKEGGAAGLKPLVSALKDLGFKKDDVVKLLKKMSKVEKHKDGDYILLPLEEAYSGFRRGEPEDPDSIPFEPTKSVSEFKEDLRTLFGKFKGDLKNPEFIKGVAQVMVSWKSLLRSQLNEEEQLKENREEEALLMQIRDLLQQMLKGDSEREEDIEDLDVSIDAALSAMSGKSPLAIDVDQEVFGRLANVKEAKKKKEKKDPPIGKPKRGGSKAYYVYVRDPKTKKVKKVSFGSGGLRAKIRNPKARKAFAARHNCKNKKDRTTAGYWSCNLPRYASQLGLGANMNTFW